MAAVAVKPFFVTSFAASVVSQPLLTGMTIGVVSSPRTEMSMYDSAENSPAFTEANAAALTLTLKKRDTES